MLHHSKTIKCAFADLLIVAACLYGCQPNEVVPELPPDHIAIRSGESVLTSAGITVIGDTINVSICPPNAYCLIANNASVSVRLVKGSDSQRVRLFAFIDNYMRRPSSVNTDSARVVLENQPYKVILRSGQYVKGAENVSQAIIQVSRL